MKESDEALGEDGAKAPGRSRLVAIVATVIGGSCAEAIHLWPEYKIPLQMTLYSCFIFGPLALALWSSRNLLGFWMVTMLTLAAHALVLYMLRFTFPFSSVLIVIPIALVEVCAIYMVALKLLGIGKDDVEQPR
jgi:hypothetical protein